jgi:multidrug efflux pump subunit AcrB
VTTIIGGLPSPRGGLTEEGSHVAGIIVTLLGNERRLVALSDVQNAWVAEGKQRMLPGLETFRIDEPARGPGGKDVDIRFTARSTEEARAIADRIRAKLEEQLGVYNVADDLMLGKSELQVRLTAGGRTLGLDEAAVGNAVRNRYFGNEALRFQDGRDEVVVRVQAPDSQRNSLDEVYRTPVPTPGGALVPLSQVATLEEARNVASIQRFNRARVVSVTADLTRETNTGTVLAALGREAGVIQKDSLFDQIQRQYQSRFLFEGVAATQAETMRGLVIGLGVAVVAIYLILVLSFRSWIQPLVIITTIPVGLIGAVFGHALLGIPFTIISIFGIVGLAGIVVNDAITFIHFVLHHFRSGQALTDAVVLAVRERFRPIIMTSATTVVGLLPLLLEQSLQAQFLIPMAASISFGLIASTIGTLVVIPALYVVLYDLVAAWKRLRNGTSITHHLKSRDESQ